MHVRFSTCVGMAVTDEHHDDVIAAITGVFVHPDTAVIEGFFVYAGHSEEFIVVSDIVHWGTVVVIRSMDAIAPIDDRVRLSALYDEKRPVLGQRIMTEGGSVLGTCADMQFETESFRVEWLFPRRWFRWKTPIPVSSILEVTPDVIRVREQQLPVQLIADERDAMNPLEAMGVSTPQA